MNKRVMTLRHTVTTPGNSQYTIVADSTRGLDATQAFTPSATLPSPGTARNLWARVRVHGSVTSVGQAATLLLYVNTNQSDTTNAAWELDAAADTGGTIPLAAGTAKLINWMPSTPDWMIVLLAGGSAPSSVRQNLSLDFERMNAGVY